MTIGVILAAGKGKRIHSQARNKTTLLFNGKPLIRYGVDLYQGWTDKIIVVAGAFKESIIKALQGCPVSFLDQGEPLGTGHAVKKVVEGLRRNNLSPDELLVGYGDHMMFYTAAIGRRMIETHRRHRAAVTLITTEHAHPDLLGWGRVLRDRSKRGVKKIVEQKDATREERRERELNAGFYCFDYRFLLVNKDKINRSPVTGEYYINEFIDLAVAQGRMVVGLKVSFSHVGIGINTEKQLKESLKLYKNVKG